MKQGEKLHVVHYLKILESVAGQRGVLIIDKYVSFELHIIDI